MEKEFYNVSDVEECHELVHNSDYGYFFAYNTANSRCYVLTESAITRRRAEEGWVSGHWTYGTPDEGNLLSLSHFFPGAQLAFLSRTILL